MASLALLGILLPSAASGANLIASHFTGNLYSLTLTETNDLIVDAEVSSGNYWPSWLTVEPASRTVFVTDGSFWAPPNGLTTFTLGADGDLVADSPVTFTEGGEVHSSLYGGANGTSFIGLAYYGSSRIITYSLPLTTESAPLQAIDYSSLAPGPHVRQEASHPHGFHLDPTGRFVLGPDLGADMIHILAVDSDTGLLRECPSARAGPGDGPRHVAFWSPEFTVNNTTGIAAVVNELSNTVTTWAISYPNEESEGCLSMSPIQSLSTLPSGVAHPDGSKAGEIRVRGDFIYVSNRADETFGEEQDSIATYHLKRSDNGTVAMEFVELVNSHTYFPRTFEINAAGDLVAVGGQTSASVAILERNTTDGRLGELVASIRVGELGTPHDEDGLSAVVWAE